MPPRNLNGDVSIVESTLVPRLNWWLLVQPAGNDNCRLPVNPRQFAMLEAEFFESIGAACTSSCLTSSRIGLKARTNKVHDNVSLWKISISTFILSVRNVDDGKKIISWWKWWFLEGSCTVPRNVSWGRGAMNCRHSLCWARRRGGIFLLSCCDGC